MAEEEEGPASTWATPERRVHRVVLTGGPCAGKTTALTKIRDFFTSVGWKVYTVPETATILLGGGVEFHELDAESVATFQNDLLSTMLQIEDTYFNLSSRHTDRNVMVICDRGAMDPSAYTTKESWAECLNAMKTSEVELRDKRYNQVICLQTAAIDATEFYQTDNNDTRTEGIVEAAALDHKTSHAWVGHPYFDFIANRFCDSFEMKMQLVVECVLARLEGTEIDVERQPRLRRRKYLVKTPLKETGAKFEDFEVHHAYLTSPPNHQVRIRARGQNGNWSYTHTVRRYSEDGKTAVDTRQNVNQRQYRMLREQLDPTRHVVKKKRRCFLYQGLSFKLDEYLNTDFEGLHLLEVLSSRDEVELPDFLEASEVTGDPTYSMYNLACKHSDDAALPNGTAADK